MSEERYRMQARWIGPGIENPESLTQVGDIATGAENYHGNLLVRCPICEDVHVISINKGDGVGWQWNESTLTIAPSAKITGQNGVCHWTLTKGFFVIWPDSTASKESSDNAKSAAENLSHSLEFSKMNLSKGAS